MGCEEGQNNLPEREHVEKLNNNRADHKRRLQSHTQPKHSTRLRLGTNSVDRLEIRTVREQVEEFRELVNQGQNGGGEVTEQRRNRR